MHRPNPARILPIVILLLVLAGAYYLYSTNRLPFVTNSADAQSNAVSGFIEGHDVNIVAEIGGRIATITVDEGNQVTAGQPVVLLDHTLLDAQIAQAQAAVNTAQAQLKQITDGAQPADVTAAQAALAAAQQSYEKLRAGPTDYDLAAAKAAVTSTQENYAKVRAGPTADQLGQLKAQVDNAKAALDQAQSAYDKVGGPSNPNVGILPQSLQLQQATNNYNAAVSAYDDARTHPTASDLAAAQSQVQQAQAAFDRLTPDAAQLAASQSQVQQAQAALDRLTPTQNSIQVAQSQVQQAQAALQTLQVQLVKMTLTSPVTGVITNRALQPGELASPGATLLTVTQLDPVTLTIYVPETELGHIQLGQQVEVQVDSFPGRNFTGRVVFINSQAEFTPRNVQTKEERVNTVFAVKLELANSTGELKPGMPADALLR